MHQVQLLLFALSLQSVLTVSTVHTAVLQPVVVSVNINRPFSAADPLNSCGNVVENKAFVLYL